MIEEFLLIFFLVVAMIFKDTWRLGLDLQSLFIPRFDWDIFYQLREGYYLAYNTMDSEQFVELVQRNQDAKQWLISNPQTLDANMLSAFLRTPNGVEFLQQSNLIHEFEDWSGLGSEERVEVLNLIDIFKLSKRSLEKLPILELLKKIDDPNHYSFILNHPNKSDLCLKLPFHKLLEKDSLGMIINHFPDFWQIFSIQCLSRIDSELFEQVDKYFAWVGENGLVREGEGEEKGSFDRESISKINRWILMGEEIILWKCLKLAILIDTCLELDYIVQETMKLTKMILKARKGLYDRIGKSGDKDKWLLLRFIKTPLINDLSVVMKSILGRGWTVGPEESIGVKYLNHVMRNRFAYGTISSKLIGFFSRDVDEWMDAEEKWKFFEMFENHPYWRLVGISNMFDRKTINNVDLIKSELINFTYRSKEKVKEWIAFAVRNEMVDLLKLIHDQYKGAFKVHSLLESTLNMSQLNQSQRIKLIKSLIKGDKDYSRLAMILAIKDDQVNGHKVEKVLVVPYPRLPRFEMEELTEVERAVLNSNGERDDFVKNSKYPLYIDSEAENNPVPDSSSSSDESKSEAYTIDNMNGSFKAQKSMNSKSWQEYLLWQAREMFSEHLANARVKIENNQTLDQILLRSFKFLRKHLRDPRSRAKFLVEFEDRVGQDAGGLSRSLFTILARLMIDREKRFWLAFEDGFVPHPFLDLQLIEFLGALHGLMLQNGIRNTWQFSAPYIDFLINPSSTIIKKIYSSLTFIIFDRIKGDITDDPVATFNSIHFPSLKDLKRLKHGLFRQFQFEEKFFATNRIEYGECKSVVTTEEIDKYRNDVEELVYEQLMVGREVYLSQLESFLTIPIIGNAENLAWILFQINPSPISIQNIKPTDLSNLFSFLPSCKSLYTTDAQSGRVLRCDEALDEIIISIFEEHNEDYPNLRDIWTASLLNFVNGSPNIPIGGLNSLIITVDCCPVETERLSTSSTCFSKIYLPIHPDYQVTRKMFIKSVMESHGFGFQ